MVTVVSLNLTPARYTRPLLVQLGGTARPVQRGQGGGNKHKQADTD